MGNRINPWEHPLAKKIWETKSEFFVWLRGNIRRIWQDYPLRKEWKHSQLRPVTKEEKDAKLFHSSTKNVGQCYLCNDWFAGSKLECDHVEESEGCFDFTTAESFLWHCAADDPSNWALVCRPCHKIKSHSVSRGVSFNEARVDKMAILVCKGDEKEWLINKGVTPGKNAKIRRQQVREIIEEEMKDGK